MRLSITYVGVHNFYIIYEFKHNVVHFITLTCQFYTGSFKKILNCIKQIVWDWFKLAQNDLVTKFYKHRTLCRVMWKRRNLDKKKFSLRAIRGM